MDPTIPQLARMLTADQWRHLIDKPEERTEIGNLLVDYARDIGNSVSEEQLQTITRYPSGRTWIADPLGCWRELNDLGKAAIELRGT